MQFWAILRDSIRESIEKKIFWVLIVVTLVVALAMVAVGFEGNKITIFFGMWDIDTDAFNLANTFDRNFLVLVVVNALLGKVLGTFGVILMIIATGGIIPAMLDRGTVDVLLSKPISRPRLFLYKYASCMVFVFLQAGFFVTVTFLVMGLRWGVWRPGYLASIPLMVLLFSYLFCVSTYVGVKTRSPVAAILVSIGAWFLFAMMQQAPLMIDFLAPKYPKQSVLYTSIKVVSWIPPKTGDFDYLAMKWAGASVDTEFLERFSTQEMSAEDHESIQRAQDIDEQQLLKSPVASIGSSLIFEAVVVLMAMWTFVRRDY